MPPPECQRRWRGPARRWRTDKKENGRLTPADSGEDIQWERYDNPISRAAAVLRPSATVVMN
jgi:hypothetical protein